MQSAPAFSYSLAISRYLKSGSISSSYYYGYQSQSSITGYDAEGQITSAIEYVTMDADELPVIYQITGHNETEIGSNFQSVVSKANANLKS